MTSEDPSNSPENRRQREEIPQLDRGTGTHSRTPNEGIVAGQGLHSDTQLTDRRWNRFPPKQAAVCRLKRLKQSGWSVQAVPEESFERALQGHAGSETSVSRPRSHGESCAGPVASAVAPTARAEPRDDARRAIGSVMPCRDSAIAGRESAPNGGDERSKRYGDAVLSAGRGAHETRRRHAARVRLTGGLGRLFGEADEVLPTERHLHDVSLVVHP